MLYQAQVGSNQWLYFSWAAFLDIYDLGPDFTFDSWYSVYFY